RRRHTRFSRDWSSDVCSSDLLPDQIYDVTAWSLPLMFNLDYQTCGQTPKVASTLASSELIKPGQVQNPDAKVAYIVPWGDMNARSEERRVGKECRWRTST